MQELRYATGPEPEVTDDVRTEIARADRLFGEAIARGDAAGAAREVYTADAVILPPGADMVRGRDQIIDFWRSAAQELALESAELSTVELKPAGEFVYQIGEADLVLGGQSVRGKYTMLWKREDGAWKWHVDCWNLNG